MEDKKDWEKHIAKAQYKTAPKKGLIEIEWREFGEGSKQIICNRSDYIWEVKKKCNGTKSWRNIICFISAIPSLNSNRISDYFGDDQEGAEILYVKPESGIPDDEDQVSDESDDDEIMFVEN